MIFLLPPIILAIALVAGQVSPTVDAGVIVGVVVACSLSYVALHAVGVERQRGYRLLFLLFHGSAVVILLVLLNWTLQLIHGIKPEALLQAPANHIFDLLVIAFTVQWLFSASAHVWAIASLLKN